MRLSVAVLATIVITTNYAVTNAELSPISSTTTSALTDDVTVMAPPGLERSLKTDNGAGIETRSLRNHREVGYEADVVDDGIEADDDEERKGGANLFAEWKLAVPFPNTQDTVWELELPQRPRCIDLNAKAIVIPNWYALACHQAVQGEHPVA
ncbi:hypothetical protein PHMEG_0004450 [Phytophthora megakarya]|uniref:RxLR effector protein n=1 Tax=Phytophthora megakarya TaxID=4795 RepID=A0A225WTX4_9STRA|nr:hypothetical protein PHMEG_0004450 [Phytophthora megakarya]